jgi:DHA3 family macrolide efflux protein-like MFS transporter
MSLILAIDIATAGLAILPLLFIAIPQPPRAQLPGGPAGAPAHSSLLADMAEGARYLRGFPGVLIIIVIGVLVRLFVWPGISLLPLVVTRHWGGGALQLAWLQTAGGVGMVLGGLILAAWGGFRRRIVTTLLALLLDGLAIALIGFSPQDGLAIAVAAFFGSGFVEPFALGPMGAIFQATVPPAMQGRVLALANAAGMAMTPLGLALAGPVADRLGPLVWLQVGGLATALMAAGAFFIRPVMHVEDRELRVAGGPPLPA